MEDKTIKISDLDAIYQDGARSFEEDFLQAKAAKGESVVYSVGGQIVKLKAEDALRLYREITNALPPEEAGRFDRDVPSEVVLDLIRRIEDL